MRCVYQYTIMSRNARAESSNAEIIMSCQSRSGIIQVAEVKLDSSSEGRNERRREVSRRTKENLQ